MLGPGAVRVGASGADPGRAAVGGDATVTLRGRRVTRPGSPWVQPRKRRNLAEPPQNARVAGHTMRAPCTPPRTIQGGGA